MSDDGLNEFADKAGSAHIPRGLQRLMGLANGSPRASVDPEDLPERTDKLMTSWEDVGGRMFFPSGRTTPHIPPGQYKIDAHPNRGLYLQRMDVNLDELLVLPDNNCDTVLKGIENFWSREEHFRRFKMLWKRGVMLWGPPGSGKTSLLQLLSRDIIQRGGITIYVDNPKYAVHMFPSLRAIEPTRPIVVILEDIDAMVRDYGESQLLALLDGEVQIENVAYVATTNYPELLDKRLINRPSRFDEVVKIGMPSAAAREVYLTTKNPRLLQDKNELQRWVSQTKDFSVAHLRELVVAVECLGHDVDKTIQRLARMNDIKVSSEQTEHRGKFGFGPNDDDTMPVHIEIPFTSVEI